MNWSTLLILPSPELFHHELFRWKLYLSDKFDDNLPSSIAETIKICDQAYFPNIYVLLQIAATIPATSCECEEVEYFQPCLYGPEKAFGPYPNSYTL